MFDQRFEKLKNDNSRIVEESSKIQTHLKDVDERMRELEGEYQNAKNCTLAETMNKNREMTMRERTYQMSSGRKRMEFQNNHLQYKYYKLLKELEVKKTTCDDLGHREEGVLGKLSRSKDEISTLEAELERMRRRKEEKNRSVL
jgi:chromosome segregation ATPase